MSSHKTFKVVIDSNVWLSGLILGGQPGEVVKLFIDGDILVVVSEELISELRRKITERFPLYLPHMELLEASILKDALVIQLGSQTVKASRDPADDKFIETAVIAGCDYIISGDKDLLELRAYENIKIVKPAEFLKLIKIS